MLYFLAWGSRCDMGKYGNEIPIFNEKISTKHNLTSHGYGEMLT